MLCHSSDNIESKSVLGVSCEDVSCRLYQTHFPIREYEIIKYSELLSTSLVTEAVKSFHEKFSQEWNRFDVENRHEMVLPPEARVNIDDVEILTFLAHCMNSVLIIVKPCTNGLGYVIVDAFCSDDVDVTQSAYYHA